MFRGLFREKAGANKNTCAGMIKDTPQLLQTTLNEPIASDTADLARVWGPFLESPETFRAHRGVIILFVSSKRRRPEARNLSDIFIFSSFTTYMKRTALQNKRVAVLGMAFRTRILSRNGPLISLMRACLR